MKKIISGMFLLIGICIVKSACATINCSWSDDKLRLVVTGSGTFSGCGDDWETEKKVVTEVSFSNDITGIESHAFNGATNLQNAYMPNVSRIGVCSFCGAENLEYVEMPNVENIDSDAFMNAKSLEEVYMPKIKTIGSGAFLWNTNLTQFEVSDSLTEVGLNALKTESNIEFIIPDSLDTTQWNNEAFGDMGGKSVTFICQGSTMSACEDSVQKFISGDSTENCEGNNCLNSGGVSLALATENECTGNHYWDGTKCNNKRNGVVCAENYKRNEDFCNRIRYTPAEAAKVLRDDNTNEITITFRK